MSKVKLTCNYGSLKRGFEFKVARTGPDWVMTTSGRYIPLNVCYLI